VIVDDDLTPRWRIAMALSPARRPGPLAERSEAVPAYRQTRRHGSMLGTAGTDARDLRLGLMARSR
jgi:hypothetical protein